MPTPKFTGPPPGSSVNLRPLGYYTDFSGVTTYKSNTLDIALAKGEILQGTLEIWLTDWRDKTKLSISPDTGEAEMIESDLVFTITNPNGQTVFDAGRVEGEYHFQYKADITGTYRLVMHVGDNHRIVEVYWRTVP